MQVAMVKTIGKTTAKSSPFSYLFERVIWNNEQPNLLEKESDLCSFN